jgi:hypothetical protein
VARETAGALAVILGSVAGAVLLGAGVWYGLSWVGGSAATPVRPIEAVAPPAVAPVAVNLPAPEPRATTAAPATAITALGGGGLEGVVTVLGMPGAQITVDGRHAGLSPRELRLAPGPHRIQLNHPTAGVADETLQVVAGERKLWTPVAAR